MHLANVGLNEVRETFITVAGLLEKKRTVAGINRNSDVARLFARIDYLECIADLRSAHNICVPLSHLVPLYGVKPEECND